MSAVEEDRVPGRAIAITAIVALAVGAIGVGAAGGILRFESNGRPSPPPPVHASPQIGIVEQTLIGATRRGLDERAKQKDALTRFGWVDRKRGIVRIPIDRAMDLVVDPAFASRALESRPDAGGPGGT